MLKWSNDKSLIWYEVNIRGNDIFFDLRRVLSPRDYNMARRVRNAEPQAKLSSTILLVTSEYRLVRRKVFQVCFQFFRRKV